MLWKLKSKSLFCFVLCFKVARLKHNMWVIFNKSFAFPGKREHIKGAHFDFDIYNIIEEIIHLFFSITE